MKKIFLVVSILSLILTLTSCSGDDATSSSVTNSTQSLSTSVDSSANTEDTPSTSNVVVGKTLSNTMFDVILTSKWTEDTESRYEGEDYTNITLQVMEGDEARISAEINIDTDDVIGFRDAVEAMGIDLYDYAVNGHGQAVNIGGYDCVMAVRNYWGTDVLSYAGRDEASGTTLTIDIRGDYEDVLVDELLSTITPKINDAGLVDYPYFWEGERISLGDISAQVGSYSLTTTNLPLEEPSQSDDIFSVRVAVDNQSKIWLGYDDSLYHYTLDNGLISGEQFPLEGTFSEVNSDGNGNIYVSDFGSNLVKIKPDKTTTTYTTVNDYIQIHPNGTWGLTYFVGSVPERVDFNGDVATISPYYGEGELFEADEVRFTKNHIALLGNEIGKDYEKIMILDQSKNPLFVLGGEDFSGDDDYLGAVTDIVETDNGFIAVDGNLRKFLFWDKSGGFIGSLTDSDLLGTSYPWISDMELLSDGSILIAFSEERQDSSGYEVLVSRLTGF